MQRNKNASGAHGFTPGKCRTSGEDTSRLRDMSNTMAMGRIERFCLLAMLMWQTGGTLGCGAGSSPLQDADPSAQDDADDSSLNTEQIPAGEEEGAPADAGRAHAEGQRTRRDASLAGRDASDAEMQSAAGPDAGRVDASGGAGTGVASRDGGGVASRSGEDGGAVSGDGSSNPNTFPAAEDFDLQGPFRTTSGAAGLACTVFRPATLGEQRRKHPVVIWGNGTFNTPIVYAELFDHFASHGFVIVAANTSDAGSGREMLDCLDWILEQNRESPEYLDKIDTKQIAASGYSQGGCGALMAGRDERFVATAPVSPFMAPLGGCDSGGAIGGQKHPMLMISGDFDAVAERQLMQAPVFAEARVPIVWATHAFTTHLEVLGNGGAYRAPLTAWFRYQLMNDPKARELFDKATCNLCAVPGWRIEYNELWTD